MYGDFSQFENLAYGDADGVWFQQGRIQLDADLNHQAALFRDWLRSLTRDLIGPFGGQGAEAGFAVALDNGGDLTFSPGHYYVQGARCVLRPAPDRKPRTLELLTGGRIRPRSLPAPPYLVHLQVWDDTVSAVADPRLLEPGLGPNPPDTTVRSRTAWRPQLTSDVDWIDDAPVRDGRKVGREWINEVYQSWNEPRDRPRLRVRVSETPRRYSSLVSPTAGYRGVENQLYRVEIHQPSGSGPAAGATFKWSRDNGSVAFAIESAAQGSDGPEGATTVLTVTSLGRDARSTLTPGDCVEVVDGSWAPFGRPGGLRSVHRVDPVSRQITVFGDVRVATSPEQPPLPILRRWDQPQDAGDTDGIPIRPGPSGQASGDGWIDLEDGIQVQFPLAGARYQRGDFWLIPARVSTGSVIWPGLPDDPAALAPNGPTRLFAPLALVTDQGVTDLRTIFVPLAVPDDDQPLPSVATPEENPAPEGVGDVRPEIPPVPQDDHD